MLRKTKKTKQKCNDEKANKNKNEYAQKKRRQ